MAYRLKGTKSVVRIFDPRWECLTPSIASHSAGIVHMAFSKSISSQRAKRSSLERMKTNKMNLTTKIVKRKGKLYKS